ncbi:transcription factor EMB1444-like [Impatiens glandulifera]|uniref:transcription factor EMB1444-like n=1 Tax=Impatiens glandulifera TaxID=253017 RepID=UPI001FB0681B|nr:transcription factor EMB1444-like [Impatiens glandulifera]
MNTENGDSSVQGLLKSLCQNNGWSYAVLWCFDHRNSSMLTMRDAYNEEQMSILIDNMLLQVHILGTGIVGQTVSSMKNRWMFSDDDDCIEQNSIFINNQDVLQIQNDRDDIHCQFSCGIKTIALIPLEMQGVVQFGSTQKIYETQEFVSQTKQILMANETTNIAAGAGFNVLEKTLSNNSSSNSDIFDEVFTSLISSTKEDFSDFFSFGSDLQLPGSFHPETDPFLHSVSSSNLFDLLPSSAVPFINQEHSEQMTSFYSVPNEGFSNKSIDLFDGLMPLNNENCLDFGDNLGFLSNESMNSIFRETEQDLVSSSVISNYIPNRTVNCISPPKKSKEEPLRNIKKRAKPGTRPKPKDRVQIRERIAELRKLVPNSAKTSIDSLLAQTVKHVLFLEGITKHAETMKRANEQKDRQSMTEPICVKDLNSPGQMMIEIHFEETDCFADIVEIINGFDLTILKGNMQTKGNKLRACFVVEAEANRHITKQHIYVSLLRFLDQKASSNMNVADDRFSYNWHQTVGSYHFNLAEALF